MEAKLNIVGPLTPAQALAPQALIQTVCRCQKERDFSQDRLKSILHDVYFDPAPAMNVYGPLMDFAVAAQSCKAYQYPHDSILALIQGVSEESATKQ